MLVDESVDLRVVGPTGAFEDLYRKEFSGVLGLAYALSGNRWIAEDLTQEAFLSAHRDWGRIGAYDDPGAWVRRVVTNLSVSAFRRRMVEAKALARLARGQVWILPELSAEDEQFWRAVRSLPRRQAQVVTLHYLEERSVVEIADVLDIAPGTVKKHLFDGRRALGRLLRAQEGEP
jgi:RNA polymerase sigma-70 factor, ECF subfamily